jgi:hypothetical protein
MKRSIWITLSSVAFFAPLCANAALEPRATSTDGLSCEAYYDTDLGITWLSDPFPDTNFTDAQLWIDGLNTANHLGSNNWRFPIIRPQADGGTTFDLDYRPLGDSAIGYNITAPGGQSDESAAIPPVITRSELAYMYFISLGNEAGINQVFPDENTERDCFNGGDGYPSFCFTQPGPFAMLQPAAIWAQPDPAQFPAWPATPAANMPPGFAPAFMLDIGRQALLNQDSVAMVHALAVAPGDVGGTCDTDIDGDGIPNAIDNCTLVPNGPGDTATKGPSQNDANSDGFGNVCDADLDDSGFVNFGDLAAFKAAFGTADPKADLNGSGFVNFADLAAFKALFGQAPGPSGLNP